MRRLPAVLAAIALPLAARAADLPFVPLGLPHQGRLLGTNDQPVTGPLPVTFSLYEDALGGNARWTETVQVTFLDGYYSVVLGDPNAPEPKLIDADLFGKRMYLGIKVDKAEELQPRLEIGTVPYALRADLANRMNGGTITGATISASSVDATEIKVNGAPIIDSDGRFLGPTGDLNAGLLGGKQATDYVLKTDGDTAYVHKSGDTMTGDLATSGSVKAASFESTATGGAPFKVASSGLVVGLNAELLGGNKASAYALAEDLRTHDYANRLQNSSFERWGAVDQPAFWNAYGSAAGAQRRAVAGYLSTNAFAVLDNDVAAVAGLKQTVVSGPAAQLYAGRTVTLSAFAKRLAGSTKGQICIADSGQDEQESSMTCQQLSDSGDWTSASVTHTVSANPEYLAVLLKPGVDAGDANDYAFDLAMLTVGPASPPWTPHVTEQLYDNGIPASKLIMGAGSGLDADLLDGLSSDKFLRADRDTTTSGTLRAGTIVSAGDASAQNVVASAALKGQSAQVSGAVSAGSASVAGALSAGATTVASLASSGDITANNVTARLQLSGATLVVSGNTSLGGSLTAQTTSLASLAVVGNGSVGGALNVTGGTTIGGNLAVNGGSLTSTQASLNLLTPQGAALPVKTGSLTVSDTYADSATVPNAFIKGNLRVGNGINSLNNVYYLNGNEAITGNDWFRLNNQSAYNNRIYTPSLFRADGGINSQNGVFYAAGSEAITANDWFRLNNQGAFNNRIYTPSLMRADGGFWTEGGYYWGQGQREMMRGVAGDGWLRLNQAGQFGSGVHTPGFFYGGASERIDGQIGVYYRSDTAIPWNPYGYGAMPNIYFHPDLGGGSGDVGYLSYYSRGGESMTMELGIYNDQDDYVRIRTPRGGANNYYYDLAEVYPVERPVDYGVVLAIDPTKDKLAVRPATGQPGETVVGVVSKTPSISIDEEGVVFGGSISRESGKFAPVALAGRIPVRVTNENGPIKAGDALTVSSKHPGFATKASGAGFILGRALSNFDGAKDSGEIVYQVGPGFNAASVDVSGLDKKVGELNKQLEQLKQELAEKDAQEAKLVARLEALEKKLSGQSGGRVTTTTSGATLKRTLH